MTAGINPVADEHRSMGRMMVAVAGIVGALGVLIGAFGAHGLQAYLLDSGMAAEVMNRRLDQFDVGARYHLVHAVALLALPSLPSISLRARFWAFVMFTFGVVLFSGSLYLLVLTNTPWLGAVTPIGGTAWILAWSTIAVSALASNQAA
ncbi:MAG: DUF423 domain-containing protein [Planctomycetaceae bacterium]